MTIQIGVTAPDFETETTGGLFGEWPAPNRYIRIAPQLMAAS
jgi:hypothetical protein